jgi:hypothetical protein
VTQLMGREDARGNFSEGDRKDECEFAVLIRLRCISYSSLNNRSPFWVIKHLFPHNHLIGPYFAPYGVYFVVRYLG